MVWCDPLHDGPVPGRLSDADLLRVRAAFLAASSDDVDQVAADLRKWRTAIERQDYDELVLWFEHDLFDQLNLIQLLAHLDAVAIGRPVTLVSVESFAGRANFKGIGELEPSDLSQLFADRRRIDGAQIALATSAWRAYRSDDPRAIEALLTTETSALPFLAAALRRHLEEFPSDLNGLSKSEQRLMEQASGGPVDLRAAFPRMHEGERGYYITDLSFVDRATELAAAAPALIALRAQRPEPRAFPDGVFELTPAGRDVLSGGADRVKMCGIDRWLGGVHLTGRGPAWRWSRDRGALVQA